MFAKLSVDFYAYFYLRVFTYKYSISFYIAGGIFTFSGYLEGGGVGGGGYCHIWAIKVCTAVKGMVFKQFTLG